MDTFDFDHHTVTTEYPDSGDRMQLGRSYTVAVAPVAPDQRILTLHFSGMRNFYDEALSQPDVTTQPGINFYRLELFYQVHKLWKKFEYTHPQYGLMVVTFNKPLQTPKPIIGLPGRLEGFTVELQEHP